MNSIKAILAGVFFIIVTTLLVQLAYIFIAVGYNSLVKDYPSLSQISSDAIRYLIVLPVNTAIMFAGGYLTAIVAKTKVLAHCITVGLITTFGIMWTAMDNADLTTSGIIINVMMLLAVIAGGFYWSRRITHSN